METILKVDSIVKEFAKVKAVNRLSFSIQKGEIFALLGPNGAGKTTTVRMLMNILTPDEGHIEYFLTDSKIAKLPFPSELGYLPEERGLYLDIPIIKTLEFMGIIRGMEKSTARKSAEEWLEKLGLLDRKNDKLGTLSKGNQQKIQFISSILHSPLFAILDEPFSGFDPINQESFLTIIKELRDKGTTILLSAHQMQLVERIADRIILINNGKEISGGSVDEIKRRHTNYEKISLTVEGTPDLTILNNEDAVDKYELITDNQIQIYLKRDKSISSLLNKVSSSFDIQSVKTEDISLHDIFIDLVNKDKEAANV